jgi:prepilin-type N-terminal cleavage/methylation domain-containing protein
MVSLKNKAYASQGFTLVELIVVITILAILATVGFISLQGYSAQSRDSKRTADLRSLSTAITTKNTEGQSLTSFVGTGTPAALALASASIAGSNSTATDYFANQPNTTTLGINASNFNDPVTGGPYRIGVTTRKGGEFQVASRLENGNAPVALVTGNYQSRLATGHTVGAAAAVGATQITFPVNSSAVGLFERGDTVIVTGNAATTLTNVSSDKLTITLAAPLTVAVTTAGTVTLGAAEVTGLIAANGSTTVAVTNNGTNLPY